MDNTSVIIGRSNLKLGQSVAKHLDAMIVNCKFGDFSNGEISFDIYDTNEIKDKHVFFIQTNISNEKSVNDYYIEALHVGDTCSRLGALSINLVYANFPYSRSDKLNFTRYSIMSTVVYNGLKNVGYNKIFSVDIHSQCNNGISNILTDDLFIRYINDNVFNDGRDDYILISPDLGGFKRVKYYADKLGVACGLMDKQRDYSKNNTVLKNTLLYGDINHKNVIIIDDMADSMGTLFSAISALKTYEIKDIIILVTHGIFTGNAINSINECNEIKKIITSNTIDQEKNLSVCQKLRVIDVSKLISDNIKNGTFY